VQLSMCMSGNKSNLTITETWLASEPISDMTHRQLAEYLCKGIMAKTVWSLSENSSNCDKQQHMPQCTCTSCNSKWHAVGSQV